MANRMRLVEDARTRMKLGWPGGVDEQSMVQIPDLLARIEELEKGLAQFARIVEIERRDNPNRNSPLVNCLWEDVRRAEMLLDPKQSVVRTAAPKPPEEQWLPAE